MTHRRSLRLLDWYLIERSIDLWPLKEHRQITHHYLTQCIRKRQTNWIVATARCTRPPDVRALCEINKSEHALWPPAKARSSGDCLGIHSTREWKRSSKSNSAGVLMKFWWKQLIFLVVKQRWMLIQFFAHATKIHRDKAAQNNKNTEGVTWMHKPLPSDK